MINRIIATTVLLICVAPQSNAALFSRLGGQAVYDDDLDITWLANANMASTNTFGVTGINADGTMDWETAMRWIAAMNSDGSKGFLGFNDWRLPLTLQPDPSCAGQVDFGGGFPLQGTDVGCTGSEMGHLYNVEGVTFETPGQFSNVQNTYWSSTDSDPFPGAVWTFAFAIDGFQGDASKESILYSWAVRPGEVPLPAAVWLFGSGLLGLLGAARLKG